MEIDWGLIRFIATLAVYCIVPFSHLFLIMTVICTVHSVGCVPRGMVGVFCGNAWVVGGTVNCFLSLTYEPHCANCHEVWRWTSSYDFSICSYTFQFSSRAKAPNVLRLGMLSDEKFLLHRYIFASKLSYSWNAISIDLESQLQKTNSTDIFPFLIKKENWSVSTARANK